MNRRLILAAAVGAGCLVAAVPAVADPVTLTYDHVVLSVTAAPRNVLVSPKTPPLQLAADLDPATGNFTVQPSGFTIPTFTLTSPLPGTIVTSLNGPATGHVDFATGAMTVSLDFIANITLNGVGSCSKDSGPLTLTTSTTKPYAGHAFPAGQTGALTGKGAFGVSWKSLAPGSGSACSLIDGFTSGPGGLWISRGINPFPILKVSKVKAPAVSSGSQASVATTVRNTGGNATAPVKACLAAPKPLKPAKQCKTLHGLRAGASKTLRFKIKTKGAGRTYKLKLTMTGSEIDKTTKVLSLKVR